METINKIDITIFNNDKGKLRYVRGVIKFFNTLKEFYPDTITQEIACPRKIETAEEFADGKYYAILKWYEAKIPLPTICNKLEEWVRTSNAKIASTNYFKNHDINKTAQNRAEDTSWIPKYSGAFNEAKKVEKTLLNYDDNAYDKKVVIEALNKDAARMNFTVEEVVEKITQVLTAMGSREYSA